MKFLKFEEYSKLSPKEQSDYRIELAFVDRLKALRTGKPFEPTTAGLYDPKEWRRDRDPARGLQTEINNWLWQAGVGEGGGER
jgi:hypothetical protein